MNQAVYLQDRLDLSDRLQIALRNRFVGARGARLGELAVDHFNRGIRAYYFGLAASGWLLNTWALGLLSVIVLIVLFRRDYSSPALRILRD